jgi:hypothetical protein
MIFAELEYEGDYDAIHHQLVAFLSKHFSRVDSGYQSDSWIWIFDGGEKVAVDSFSSMKHQVKSAKPGPHVQGVIETLQREYKVTIYESPEFEAHEDPPRGHV